MEKTKYGIVFTGQGSQRQGMAQDFYNEYQISKEIFKNASQAIDCDLEKICFDEDPRLNLTEFTQPAILTAEIVMFEVLSQEFGLRADLFAGHSLGEYTALVAAGVIPFESAVKIVKERGRLMQQAVPEGIGAMAALIMDNIEETKYKEIVSKNGGQIANLNSKQQVVISGEKEKISACAEALKKTYSDMSVVFLNTSAPFHSALMKVIEQDFENYLNRFSAGFRLENAKNVLSNYTGSFHNPAEVVKNLVHQISGAVLWMDNMTNMANGTENILEVGPNRVLAKFFSTIGKEVNAVINIRSAKKIFS
jgi:malonyl CoA-acyl carrier protein transacylase